MNCKLVDKASNNNVDFPTVNRYLYMWSMRSVKHDIYNIQLLSNQVIIGDIAARHQDNALDAKRHLDNWSQKYDKNVYTRPFHGHEQLDATR